MSTAILYRMRIGWNGTNSGYFLVGSSKIAPLSTSPGYDKIGEPLNAPNYTGTYDLLPAGKFGPDSFTLTRGRDGPYSNMLAGKLDLTVQDVYPGRYNPKNTASPIYGKIVPMRPGSLDASLDGGNTYIPLFTGWMSESSSNPDWPGSATFTFLDLFIWLTRAKNVVIASTGPTTAGAAINLVLDAVGWPSYLRSISTGGPIPGFSVALGENLLTVVSELIAADQGYFFHSRANIATYWDRYEMARRRTSVATYTASSTQIPGNSVDDIKNIATAAVEGGPQQYYQDDVSGGHYGFGAWPGITSKYFNSNSDAHNFCVAEVAYAKDPIGKVWIHKLDELGDSPDSLLTTEFLDRVTVSSFGSNTDYHVQKMVHTGGGGVQHRTNLVLAERQVRQPFIVGRSKIAPLSTSTGYDSIWR